MENVSREILTSEEIFLFPRVSSAFIPNLSRREKEDEKGRERMESCGFRMPRDADRKFGKSITKIANFQVAIISSFHVFIIAANRA